MVAQKVLVLFREGGVVQARDGQNKLRVTNV